MLFLDFVFHPLGHLKVGDAPTVTLSVDSREPVSMCFY
uniref:Uncharacterized protein n=1 Tax=Anguilla anguilla TaxID=7936 RepID=A0A0E9TPY8_ANGAN